jgi:DNA mismatch repair protein MutL
MRIQQLPAEVAARIAAGEVIERPASVVKELLENAVDAGSRRIDVEVEQGGTDLVRVVDDGCGILPADLPLAFASHATSKLTTADDLFRVMTLGFRGEALASIGGVAQVRLQSRCPDEIAGAEINCDGGKLSAPRTWSGAAGTRVEVAHLFYNTPVRRKFLRTVATEMGHVCESFTRLALAHGGLNLKLRHNGKEVWEVPGVATLLDRIGLFFGSELRDRLYDVDVSRGPATLKGFIADPSCDRGNAKLQYMFVNRRWVRDRSLGHALQEAYRGLLMTGRYAIAFLFLELPPDQVDVNVHPTKAEVRFRDGHALYHLLLTAVRDRLRAANLTARLRITPTADGFVAAPPTDRGSPALEMLTGPAVALQSPRPGPACDAGPTNAVHETAGSAQPASTRSSPKVIQLHDSYLVLETPEGLLVIDQHALHERILFEQLKTRLRAGSLDVQRMLIPEPVNFPPEHAARALAQRAALEELGLGVEDFGGGTLLLTGYPAILGNRPPHDILRAVVDYLVARDRLPTREQLLNDILSLMACHAAVRAGDRLSTEAIDALLAQRDLVTDSHHCPHGRPTSLFLSRHDLDRQFRRL